MAQVIAKIVKQLTNGNTFDKQKAIQKAIEIRNASMLDIKNLSKLQSMILILTHLIDFSIIYMMIFLFI
jgi:hypothetical protein